MGFQRPETYAGAIARALARYGDEALARGENLLDSWGLMQACFRYHDSLDFGAVQVKLNEGCNLNELSPAPRFPDLWKKPEAMPVLLGLVTRAQSRLVRLWAMQLVKRDHAERVAQLKAEQIFELLEHEDEEVQQFGSELLASCPELSKLPIETWLKLLTTRSPAALEAICELMEKHVTADRLELADCIRMACAEPAPVARAGFQFLRSRAITTPEDRDAVAAVASAKCFALAGDLAEWALGIVGHAEHYDRNLTLKFFDALLGPVRRRAWQWLIAEQSPGYGDPGLWCRLVESPYDDLRLGLVDELTRRAALPGTGADDLTPVWSAVLLGVHRGGRQKLKAVRQVAAAIEQDPGRAEALVPVLAVAVRSVRGPESRAGLAATVGLIQARPELCDLVASALPELEFEPETAS
jgi:hypothetical protein